VVSVKDSAAVRNFWAKAQETADKRLPPPLSRGEYLADIAPTSSSALADPLADAAGGGGGAAGGAGGKPSAQSISKEAQDALVPALKALFMEKKHHVCNMANVRHWLQVRARAPPPAPQALRSARSWAGQAAPRLLRPLRLGASQQLGGRGWRRAGRSILPRVLLYASAVCCCPGRPPAGPELAGCRLVTPPALCGSRLPGTRPPREPPAAGHARSVGRGRR
jgi:hypothetical protein